MSNLPYGASYTFEPTICSSCGAAVALFDGDAQGHPGAGCVVRANRERMAEQGLVPLGESARMPWGSFNANHISQTLQSMGVAITRGPAELMQVGPPGMKPRAVDGYYIAEWAFIILRMHPDVRQAMHAIGCVAGDRALEEAIPVAHTLGGAKAVAKLVDQAFAAQNPKMFEKIRYPA